MTASADDCCGAEPPEELVGENGKVWVTGDCWCTLRPGHDPKRKHTCEPCTERFGFPGWYDRDHQEVPA